MFDNIKILQLKNYIIKESQGNGFSINKMKKDLKVHEINGKYITRALIIRIANIYKIPLKFIKKSNGSERRKKTNHGYSYGIKNKCNCGICRLSLNIYRTSADLNRRTPKTEGIAKRKKLNIKTCDEIANLFGNIYEINRKEALEQVKQYRIEKNIWIENFEPLLTEEKIRKAAEKFKIITGKYPTCMSGYSCTESLGHKSWRSVDDWMKKHKNVTLFTFFTGKVNKRRKI